MEGRTHDEQLIEAGRLFVREGWVSGITEEEIEPLFRQALADEARVRVDLTEKGKLGPLWLMFNAAADADLAVLIGLRYGEQAGALFGIVLSSLAAGGELSVTHAHPLPTHDARWHGQSN